MSTIMSTEDHPETAITESGALRLLDWPASRRADLRGLLPSVPTGSSLLYERAAVEALKDPAELARVRSSKNNSLFTRSAVAAPPAEMLHRSAEFNRASVDDKTRTVELAFSSEAPVARWFGNEILDHSPGAVRLGRLNNGGALLLDHDPGKQIGVVVSARIDRDRKGRATVRFGKGPLAEEIFQDVKDGIRRLVSVGYRIHSQANEGRSGGLESVRVTDWEPHELSIVSIPADDSVGIGRGIESTHSQIQISESNLMNTQDTIERNRVSTILDIAAQARAQGIQFDDRRAIADGITPEQARAQVFDALIGRQVNFSPGTTTDNFSSGERRDIAKFSLVRAIRDLGEGRGLSGIELELDREGRRLAAAAGNSGRSSGNLSIPLFALNHGRRDMTATGGTNGDQGGSTIVTDHAAFTPLLYGRNILQSLGATILTGLNGNLSIPKLLTGSTVGHLTETGASSESSPTTGQVLMTPHRIGTHIEVTKQLLIQTGGQIEQIIRGDLNAALSAALEIGAINGSGADNQPTGILNTLGIGDIIGGDNGAAPTWDDVVDLEAAVAALNADQGRLGYLTNPKVRAKLKKTIKAAGIPEFIWDKGALPLNGSACGITTNVPSTLTKGSSGAVCSALIFGNWQDVVIGQWGSIDLLVNPYLKDTEGLVRITADAFYDIGVRRAASFAAMRDALTA